MLRSALFLSHATSTAAAATLQLLKKLGVPVTAQTVKETVEGHPDAPSLWSISDALTKWKVESISLQVEPEKLNDLPTPFLAFTRKNGGSFEVVTKVTPDTVSCTTAWGGSSRQSREEFLKQWSGVVLLAEKNTQSGEKNYKANRKKELWEQARVPIIIFGFLLLAILSIAAGQFFSSFTMFLLLLKLLGCVITGLLLWYELDKSNPALQQICSGGAHTNCNAVLGSRQSKLWNKISWSEIGFAYFAGGVLTLSLLKGDPAALLLLAWLNLLALPYTLFSVYYQWRVVKQWCPLCLAVQAILVLEALLFYLGFWIHYTYRPIELSAVFPMLTLFALPVFFWLFTKPVLQKAQQADGYRNDLSRLKYNRQLFESLLYTQKKVEVPTAGLGITLGNLEAKNMLIKVCNPYCGPCAKAHSIIEEVLEGNKDVKVQIIFTATNEESDARALPVKHFMALQERGDENLLQQALDDWYGAEKKDYDAFAAKYKMNAELHKQGEKLARMNAWCTEMKIEATPTFFVNGYRLPEVYNINDLKHLFQ